MSALMILREGYPIAFCLMSGILGAILGSFLGVVVERLPARVMAEDAATDSLMYPASHCAQCLHLLNWWENIPLFSWVLLRGRCAHCNTAIPLRLLVTEGLTLLFFALSCWYFPAPQAFLSLWIVWCALLPLTLIDLRHLLLPDAITQPLLWGGLLLSAITGRLPLVDALYGAVAGYLVLWLLYWFFLLLTRREGLGYGDFKLLAALGAWVGWQALPTLVFFAAVCSILFYFCSRRISGELNVIPFGPGLSLAGLTVLILQLSDSGL
ncbi:A24 family peptidase [Scandinavium sp. H11S7]|uniref:Prepilin leader peptidase/N-methyltransferase n=1 Tax=Scandinavium hiltneri TaxID=2926519 RepID=A0ABT2E600_9ENTR|nr:A24 family peptidase [Scandinavium hiltneri]MCS2158438.1 A24 family peptidase [Scandinavium hiltneri]MCS2163304.1 A24 family peptidase [Scandinavium hiltneri]